MFQYIYKDIASVMQYFPYGLAIGIPAAFVLFPLINRKRVRKGEKSLSLPLFFLWCIYVTTMLVITLFSRESGSNNKIDLELFSTFRINKRNDAFVVENILLFIPYGLLSACNFKHSKNVLYAILIGMITSLFIETTQLITGRGIFQVDDILTNTLGMLIGCLLYLVIHLFTSHETSKED